MVVERHVWPYYPDRNDVIFNSSPVKIQNSVVQIEEEITNPNSTFQQIQAQRIAEATNWLLSGDGYVVAVQDNDGNWKELLFLDTNDIATAQKVLRINENGIGFSTTGAQGPYTNAWTIDGQLNADFITTGTLTANIIKLGVLSDMQGNMSWDLANGNISAHRFSINTNNFVLSESGQVSVYGYPENPLNRHAVDISGGVIQTRSSVNADNTGGDQLLKIFGNRISSIPHAEGTGYSDPVSVTLDSEHVSIMGFANGNGYIALDSDRIYVSNDRQSGYGATGQFSVGSTVVTVINGIITGIG
jgi:hypothetical protein